MKREDKESQIKELSEAFESHGTFYLLDFINMPVSQSVQLRRRLRDQSYTFRVIKNRLALRALREDFPDDLREFFVAGCTAHAVESYWGCVRASQGISISRHFGYGQSPLAC